MAHYLLNVSPAIVVTTGLAGLAELLRITVDGVTKIDATLSQQSFPLPHACSTGPLQADSWENSEFAGNLHKITIFAWMISASVDTMVPKIQAVLSGKPVTRAWIFGSYSRGEETPQSDVDILVQYDNGCRISLMDISRIMVELSKALGVPVDLVEDGRLLPFAVESANRDKILVYERAS